MTTPSLQPIPWAALRSVADRPGGGTDDHAKDFRPHLPRLEALGLVASVVDAEGDLAWSVSDYGRAALASRAAR